MPATTAATMISAPSTTIPWSMDASTIGSMAVVNPRTTNTTPAKNIPPSMFHITRWNKIREIPL